MKDPQETIATTFDGAAVTDKTSRPTAVLVAFIFSLAAFQGFTINLMPLLFDTIDRAFDLNLRQEGQLQSFSLIGAIFGLSMSGYVTEIVRAKRSGMLALFVIGLGSLLLGFATTYTQVLLAAIVIGMGDMWVIAVYSAVITKFFPENRQRMFMWTLAAFAGSAAVGNTLFGFLLDSVSPWQWIFIGFGVLTWLWLVLLMLIAGRRLDVIGKPARTSGTSTTTDLARSASVLATVRQFLFSGIFNRGTFWMLGFLVVLDNLVAGNMVAWTARYFQLEYAVGNKIAGSVLGSVAAGVFVGRLVLGTFISGRFSDRVVLGTCYGLGLLMYVLVLAIPNYQVGMALMFLAGAFIAAQAPTMYSLASEKFGDRAATAIPLMDAVGALGGLGGPVLIGALADESDLATVLWIIPALGAFFVAIVFTWEWIDRRPAQEKSIPIAPLVLDEP
ncbi:MAG: MFS transporter [Planctomycetes bacterium]|nr:MFS transporter [Planctomycetota bacterium]